MFFRDFSRFLAKMTKIEKCDKVKKFRLKIFWSESIQNVSKRILN